MDINCTLFIQCFNFGIAYLILTRLIFKPALACIFEERAKRDAVQQAIKISQEAIKKLEAKRTDAWQTAQVHFSRSIQEIPYQHREMPITYEYGYSAATDEQIEAQASRIHDAIMKKVSDDFK